MLRKALAEERRVDRAGMFVAKQRIPLLGSGLLSSLLFRRANERLHQGEALPNCRGEAAKQTLVCTPQCIHIYEILYKKEPEK